MKRLFFGGVHPKYKKEMSMQGGIASVTPDSVAVPLKQHIGNACAPLVAVGDYVRKGQKIGDGDGMCVPVHASVSGCVAAIEPRLTPNGQTVDTIIINNDFKNDTVSFGSCDLPIEEIDPENILHSIREAGIVGMGGAAFPGNLKALSALGNIDTLIANGCECEPYITADDMLLRTGVKKVLEGMLLLCRVLNPKRAVLAVEDNKAVAIKAVKEALKDYPTVELKVLPTRYPQGSEKQLIQAVTDRQVPYGLLPKDAGCVVFNVSTFAAVFAAVREGAPLTERIVTVTGEGVKAPQNFNAPIGTAFSILIEKAGGLCDDADRVLNGGPMMGTAQSDLSVPVVKATNAVLCLKPDKNDSIKNSVCIRCGKCVEACPMHLMPLYIARNVGIKDIDELKRLNVTDCIECGCCSFICPAKLPLTEKCRTGKKILREENKNEA